MPVNDPIADLLTRMRNAQHARRTECVIPWSKIKLAICELLKAEGYLGEVSVAGEGIEKEITVAFLDTRPVLQLLCSTVWWRLGSPSATEIRGHISSSIITSRCDSGV